MARQFAREVRAATDTVSDLVGDTLRSLLDRGAGRRRVDAGWFDAAAAEAVRALESNPAVLHASWRPLGRGSQGLIVVRFLEMPDATPGRSQPRGPVRGAQPRYIPQCAVARVGRRSLAIRIWILPVYVFHHAIERMAARGDMTGDALRTALDDAVVLGACWHPPHGEPASGYPDVAVPVPGGALCGRLAIHRIDIRQGGLIEIVKGRDSAFTRRAGAGDEVPVAQLATFVGDSMTRDAQDAALAPIAAWLSRNRRAVDADPEAFLARPWTGPATTSTRDACLELARLLSSPAAKAGFRHWRDREERERREARANQATAGADDAPDADRPMDGQMADGQMADGQMADGQMADDRPAGDPSAGDREAARRPEDGRAEGGRPEGEPPDRA